MLAELQGCISSSGHMRSSRDIEKMPETETSRCDQRVVTPTARSVSLLIYQLPLVTQQLDVSVCVFLRESFS